MTIFLDSAVEAEIENALKLGWVQGVTTNPTIMANANRPVAATLAQLAGLPFSEVFYQVRAGSVAEMHAEAAQVAKILGDKFVVKIPPTPAGFTFASEIKSIYKSCITAVFSPAQAKVARDIGVNYIAVYVNRATNLLGDGPGLTADLLQVLNGSNTKVLAASLKTVEAVSEVLLLGVDAVTLPANVLQQMTQQEFSQQAVDAFTANGLHLE